MLSLANCGVPPTHIHAATFSQQSTVIAAGAFGKVFEGEYDGHPIAIKQVTCADIGTSELQNTCFELMVSSTMAEHRNNQCP